MKKSILLLLMCWLIVSCKKQPNTVSKTTTPSTTISISAGDLVGNWIYDSVVSYSAGVRQALDYPGAYPANGAYLNLLSTSTGNPNYYDGSGKSYYIGSTATTIGWDLKIVNSKPYFDPHTSNMAVGYIRSCASNILIIDPGNNPLQGLVFYMHK